MPHDIIPTWQRVRDLTADRDSWRRLAEDRAVRMHGRTVAAMARLKAQLSEARKQLKAERRRLKRLERITHCKECRCKDNPRKEYFRERYEHKKLACGNGVENASKHQ